jgi:predicted HAD superfamily Cof-like phosphohydrolase
MYILIIYIIKMSSESKTNMTSTNFQKVKEFMTVFKQNTFTTPQLNVFTEDPHIVRLREALIEEEFKELQVAIKNNDMVEVADALTDLLYVIYGAGHAFGIDLDKSFDIVHNSNMTKACNTEEEAKETVKTIKEKGTYKDPQYRKEGKYWVVFDNSNGKILKSNRYTPADLTFISK